jgi:hypothetical protein
MMGRLTCCQIDAYANDIARLRQTVFALADEIADFRGVGQVVDWFSARGDGRPAIDMIAMDEFEYDFLVQTEIGWLAFGVT